MRHGVEQHHAQQNQTDADDANEIRFPPEKRYADQSRQNQSHACQSGITVASGIVFSAIDKVQNTPKSWLPRQQKRVGFVANLVSNFDNSLNLADDENTRWYRNT